MILKSKQKSLPLDRPLVMAILNVTPDSFSDGGRYNSIEAALVQADKMVSAGVSIIDIGGESTRPGAPEVSLEEELKRTIPVIKAIREKHDIWISIDTSKAEVMKQAIEAGADIVNDVRALSEPGALDIVARYHVPVCIMHMQGQPDNMQNDPQYDHLLSDVEQFLQQRIDACVEAGIEREKIILDPGFGFGKTLADNYQLLDQFDYFHKFQLPLLAGMSRKSMIFNVLHKKPDQCVAGSIACATIAAMKGAHIVRVHDFEETLDAMNIVSSLGNKK
ncbi:dihydropteroate synthase [Vibrio sp. SCSIO 43137]|uniref:dihydropteroate synthase n=1 Tax=Vibrio sp. SCSIO 43137 TaxID=3021011 RepID=UPI002307E513|nr:dihydropteroate synthase [Vibrio sp. SCSIO 43137]WCE29172.1 dihydropteroate synthase [Vibrio sp. SCSIO 43137]